METKNRTVVIRTPDHRLRVFVSSTLKELAEERNIIRQAISQLKLVPVMFESGARPHPAQELYRAYLSQSHIFIGVYWQSYGWVAPGMEISGLEDEYLLSKNIPKLIYIKNPAPEREHALKEMLARIKDQDSVSYKYFSTPGELRELVENDVALLLSENFETARALDEPLPVETPARPVTNVPIPRNPLVGREQELAAACSLLQREDVGLVTLTGPGGTGKSRLGIQIALSLQDNFKDGVYLVRLSSLSSPHLVWVTVASTLNLRDPSNNDSVINLLKTYFRDKQILLMLDNFEQVMGAAPTISELLETCPQLKLIVTSRSPLQIRGEKELFVPPLSVPEAKYLSDIQDFSQYDAVKLFIQRARDIKPDFKITNENAPAVAEICHRLDGLPLAIELAAVRIKLLSPQELLHRLEHRLDVLKGGASYLPERQQTLRSTIDWSYKLLDVSAKILLRRLSIFVSGWTLEAAEAICSLGDNLNVMDAMDSLVKNSLITHSQDEMDSPTRFGMLEIIREYASECLTKSGETDSLRSYFSSYYLGFVTKFERRVKSSERVYWVSMLQREMGNIRAILDWICLNGKNVEIGQQIVIKLGWSWLLSGHLMEGRQWVNQLKSYLNTSTPVPIVAGLNWLSGGIAWAQGDIASALADLEESVRLAKTTDDRSLQSNVAIIRGLVAASMGDLATANSKYQECIDISRAEKDKWCEALALSWLGDVVANFEKDIEWSNNLHDQSIVVARELGDPWCIAVLLMASGHSFLFAGDLDKAKSAYLESISLMETVGDDWSLAWTLAGMGHTSLLRNEDEYACKIFEKSLALAQDTENPIALVVSLLGTAALLSRRWKVNMDQSQHVMLKAVYLCRFIETLNPGSQPFFWTGWHEIYRRAIDQIKEAAGAELWQQGYSQGETLNMRSAIALAMQELKIEV